MIQLTDATFVVNDEAVGIIPNSLKFTEGKGEQKARAVSVGEGKTEIVVANDLETAIGRVMVQLPVTVDAIKLALKWKNLTGQNVVQIAGKTLDGNVSRSYTQATLVNDYEVEVGTDTNIELEFHGNAPI